MLQLRWTCLLITWGSLVIKKNSIKENHSQFSIVWSIESNEYLIHQQQRIRKRIQGILKMFQLMLTQISQGDVVRTIVSLREFDLPVVMQKYPPEVFCKRVFLEISQSTCARVSFLIKLQPWALSFANF